MLAKTSKGTCGPCILYLEDGTIFYGRACGAEGTATGEVCFNTSLEGYFEVMTDPELCRPNCNHDLSADR